VVDLLGRDDRHGADDGVPWEARAVRGLDADAILDEDEAGPAVGDEGRDEGGVVGAVREGLGGHDDVVPLWDGSGGGRDRRVHGLGVEGVVAERVRLEGDAVGCEGGVVGSGDEGRADVVGWLVGMLEDGVRGRRGVAGHTWCNLDA